MTVDRESGGALIEQGFVGRESGGSIIESGKVWREEGGSLTLVYLRGFDGTLVPVSDVTFDAANWGDTDGNGDAWDELDEDPHDGDTTIVSRTTSFGGNVSGEDFRVALSNPGVPPSGDESMVLSWASKLVELDGTGSGSVTVQLWDGATEIVNESRTLGTAGYGGVHTLSQAEKDLISNYDDLEVEVTVDLTADDVGSRVEYRCTQIKMEFTP